MGWLLLLLLPLGTAEAEDVQADDDERDPGTVDLGEPVDEEPLPDPRLRPWFGPRVGLALPADPLRPALFAAVEVGLVLPWADERLRPVLSLGWARPSAELSGSDPSLDDDWRADISVDQLRLGAGLRVRVLGRRAPVSPELGLSPQLWLTRTHTRTSSGDALLSDAVDDELLPALEGSAGLVGAVGPGQLGADIALALARASGSLTGDASLRTVAVTLSYRLEP